MMENRQMVTGGANSTANAMNVDQFLSSMREASNNASGQPSRNDIFPRGNYQHNMFQTRHSPMPQPRTQGPRALPCRPSTSTNFQAEESQYRPPYVPANVPIRHMSPGPRYAELQQPDRQQMSSHFKNGRPFFRGGRPDLSSNHIRASVGIRPQSVNQLRPRMGNFSEPPRAPNPASFPPRKPFIPRFTENPQLSAERTPPPMRPAGNITQITSSLISPSQQFVTPDRTHTNVQLTTASQITDKTGPVNSTEISRVNHSEDNDFQRRADQEWVDRWLLSLNKQKKTPARKSVVTIANYKCCLQEALKLKQELNGLVVSLQHHLESDEWQQQFDQITKIKLRLESLNHILTDEATLENITQLCVKRKTKRERLKRQRHELYQTKQSELDRRKGLHKAIDTVQERLVQKSLQEKQDKEMKATADKILSEVRRKLVETGKTLELIRGLRKLRELRCRSVYTKGMYLGMESDDSFKRHTEKLLTLLENQKKVYETEEKTLKVMLETEQEETKERERENKRRAKEAKERAEKRHILHCLFGKEDKLLPDDPLLPYKLYYRQAETSLENLISVRQGWDMYLVPEFTPGSSAVPMDWVRPDQPSSDVWASFVKQNQDR